ncbi:MAG: Ig-like domain-containing protein [Gemmatimonadaceae bacterium]
MSRQFFVRSVRVALAASLLSCTETTAPDTTVATVSVSIPRPMVRVGESIQATAQALNPGGDALSVTNVARSSSDVSIATISPTGLVAALAPGDARVQAMTDGKVGVASLKITIVPVASIAISATTSTVSVGQIRSSLLLGRKLVGSTRRWHDSR